MNTILILARYFFLNSLRRKIMHLAFLFAGLFLVFSLLLGVLGQEAQTRITLDLGLAAMEFLAMLAVIFLTVQTLQEEIESRNIYLILTRPVLRWQYVLACWAGIGASVLFLMALMALTQSAILFLSGASLAVMDVKLFLLSFLTSYGKVLVMGAGATVFALMASSLISALWLCFLFWFLGGFSRELYFISLHVSPTIGFFLRGTSFILPRWELFNARDLWLLLQQDSITFLFRAAAYGLSYASALLLIAILVFRRREF